MKVIGQQEPVPSEAGGGDDLEPSCYEVWLFVLSRTEEDFPVFGRDFILRSLLQMCLSSSRTGRPTRLEEVLMWT